MNREKLLALLQSRQIPLDIWNEGDAKSFDHLAKEVESGEVTIEVRATPQSIKLVRVSCGAALKVFYNDEQDVLELHEARQVFADGREKIRNLNTSIGEKMLPGEFPVDAAYRALEEELGIGERLPLSTLPTEYRDPVLSTSYPGLYSQFTIYMFSVFLPDHLYKAEGYIEKQKDKTNYYEWRRYRGI